MAGRPGEALSSSLLMQQESFDPMGHLLDALPIPFTNFLWFNSSQATSLSSAVSGDSHANCAIWRCSYVPVLPSESDSNTAAMSSQVSAPMLPDNVLTILNHMNIHVNYKKQK